MVRRSSSASRSRSAASDRRACQPHGSPSWSQVTECHGPAHTTNSATGTGGVAVSSQWPSPSVVGRPLPRTVQAGSAVTVSAIGPFRSFWSKDAKTRWAMSMPQ